MIVYASNYILFLVLLFVLKTDKAHTKLFAERLNQSIFSLFFLYVNIERSIEVHSSRKRIFCCEVSDVRFAVAVLADQMKHPLMLVAYELDNFLDDKTTANQHVSIDDVLELVIHLCRTLD